jgi:hypothetical protein
MGWMDKQFQRKGAKDAKNKPVVEENRSALFASRTALLRDDTGD